MNFLLRLKPWHLFVLLLIPWVFSLFSAFAAIWHSVLFVVYAGWAYAIGIKMNALLPEAIRPGITSFKIHYWLLVSVTIIAFNVVPYIQLPAHSGDYSGSFQVIFLFTYFYLLFNVWMFAARMLESNFQKGIANRSDSLKAFFCFWLFPFGIWHIQPAVQKALAKYESNITSPNSPS